MLKIKEAIIVEGNYDKIKLSSCVDALILTTDGFGVFKNREKLELIRTLAEQIGVILLTDADRAGFTIRNYVKQGIGKDKLKHAYIPDIKGKEKRKDTPSKEGLLGVEGMEKELLIDALLKAGCDSGRRGSERCTVRRRGAFAHKTRFISRRLCRWSGQRAETARTAACAAFATAFIRKYDD